MTQENSTTPLVRTQADRPKRGSRIPFGVARTKLSVPMEIPGYHTHWVNDVAGRIQEAQRGGYTFVEPKEVQAPEDGSQVKRLVGKNEDGSAMYAYLMKIENEFYAEDQQLIQSEVDRFDSAIKRGTLEEKAGENRYSKINITQS